jgi:hypothetical protein
MVQVITSKLRISTNKGDNVLIVVRGRGERKVCHFTNETFLAGKLNLHILVAVASF